MFGVLRAELDRLVLTRLDHVVERALARLGGEPPELQSLPRAHVGRRVADAVGAAVADVGARGHQGPEGSVVLGAAGVAGGVVEVGQAEVVAELVGEHTQAAVLGLHGVVVDPDAGRVVRDQRTGHEAAVGADVDTGADRATGLEVRG